jgi:cytochrome c553
MSGRKQTFVIFTLFLFAFLSCAKNSSKGSSNVKNKGNPTSAVKSNPVNAEPFPEGKRITETGLQIGLGYTDKESGAPLNGLKGVFSCPTVGLPVYEGEMYGRNTENEDADTSKLASFRSNCGACHGLAGEGKQGYPALPGGISKEEYLAIVRNGKGSMPSFSANLMSDVQILSDYDLLSGGGLKSVGVKSSSSPYLWPQPSYEKALLEGLTAWRKPDKAGVACANCHAPDGLDLALIGYPDHAIVRRGREHLDPNDVNKIVGFIHATRKKFSIARPCSPTWRPFQPGGEVLPGNTPEEQDIAFSKVLEEKLPVLVKGKVTTFEEAQKAFADLGAIDLRRLPIGIALPRWTEDPFNGEAHNTNNDYLPPLGAIPKTQSTWYRLEDEYISTGSDSKFYEIMKRLNNETSDGGFAAAQTKGATGNCYEFSNPGSFILRVNEHKKHSVLLGQHLMRKEVLKTNGSWDSTTIPLSNSPQSINSFMLLGGQFVEPPCYDDLSHGDLYDTITDGFRKQLPQEDQSKKLVKMIHKDLTHPWMTLGQVIDQSLLNSDTNNNNKLQYWSDLNFTQKWWHEPFFYAHRVASAVAKSSFIVSEKQVQPNKKLSRYADTSISPLLQGETLLQMRVHNVTDVSQNQLFLSNRFKGNLIRTFLLIQKDLLKKGSGIKQQGMRNCDHGLCLAAHREKILSFVSNLKAELAKPQAKKLDAALVAEQALYTSDIEALANEVYGTLMSAAPKL